MCRQTLLTGDYLPNPSRFLQRYQLLATRTRELGNTGGSKSTHVTSIPASHQFIMQISKRVAYLLAPVVLTHQSEKHVRLKFS